MTKNWPIEPVLLLLFLGICFFLGMGVFVEFKFPNDRELFTLISGLVTGFAGAFLMRVKPQSKSDEVPPGTTQVESVSIAKTPVTPAVEEVAK